MAKITLTLSEGETWIYPALSYTGYDGVKKTKNHWYKGHSVLERRGVHCYQGGTSQSDGKYNGNMFSILKFKDSSGRTLKNAVKNIGGSAKITKITLKMNIERGWGGYFTPRICMTPYWDTSSLTGNSKDTYDGLKFKYLFTTGSLKTKAWHEINLTSYKSHFDTYESLAFYCPGAYNASNSSYGAIYAHKSSYPPTLVIEYDENSAPKTPSVSVTSTKDSNGYTLPSVSFKITSNGDPDNNLHSSPYAYKIYDQNGKLIKEGSWSSSNTYTFDASSYRGKTIKIRGIVRDTYGLTAHKETNAYINSKPYWASGSSVTYDSGVTDGIFENTIKLSWPKATDAQSNHASNLRYSVYVQKGTDSGANGDTSSNCISSNLTSTSLTVDAANMDKMSVAKGERIYFSVWVSDGLEWSSSRITSSWIYREKPPSAPSNVAPTSGHYESSVKVSWGAASGNNGSTIDHYVVKLLNASGTAIKTYTTKSTSYTCTDITSIDRGQEFKFQVYAVDNLDNSSTSAYSGTLTRNSAPTKPLSFKINSSDTSFKNSIPLVWSASSDKDGDTVKYVLSYNVNGGAYSPIESALTGTTYSHDVTGFKPGDKIGYTIEAYDTFNVYSKPTYIATEAEINSPSESPTITLPISDRTLYTNQPRIVFRTSTSNNSKPFEVIINVNGTTYSSKTNSSLFDNSEYGSNKTGVFIVPSDAPLNYSKKNTVKIKSFDGLDYSSSEKSYNFIVEYPTVEKIGSSEDRFIKASELTSLKSMINSTRFAYNMSELSWYSGADQGKQIYKKFYEQASNGIHDVSTTLNDKTSNASFKRTYTKDSFVAENVLKKSMFNKLIDIITKP